MLLSNSLHAAPWEYFNCGARNEPTTLLGQRKCIHLCIHIVKLFCSVLGKSAEHCSCETNTTDATHNFAKNLRSQGSRQRRRRKKRIARINNDEIMELTVALTDASIISTSSSHHKLPVQQRKNSCSFIVARFYIHCFLFWAVCFRCRSHLWLSFSIRLVLLVRCQRICVDGGASSGGEIKGVPVQMHVWERKHLLKLLVSGLGCIKAFWCIEGNCTRYECGAFSESKTDAERERDY